jgi:probable HAF family extracellular repeat protein
MRIGPAIFFLTALLAAAFVEARPPAFRLKDVGSLNGGSTFATALNDQGQVGGMSVVGSAGPHSSPPANAFLYSNGLMTDLFDGETNTVSEATAINETGQVVGYRRWDPIGPSQAFQYSEATGVAFLNPFEIEFALLATGAATGINESGEIVGSAAAPPGFQSRAFLLSPPSSKAFDLTPDLEWPFFGSAASAINDEGLVVGVLVKVGTSPTYDTGDAFLFDGVSLTNLDERLENDFLGASFEPRAINANGEIAGYVYGLDRSVRAFVYAGDAFVELGTLGGSSSWGHGIDDAERVVGDSLLPDGATIHAFLWDEGVMFDLNDFVSPAAGVVLSRARAINEAGQIVAWGYSASEPSPTATWHSFLLTPYAPTEAVDDLIDLVGGMNLHHGIENSLTAKLENALAALEAGDVERACDLLAAFLNEVHAQTGKKIPEADAAILVDEATFVRGLLGCV